MAKFNVDSILSSISAGEGSGSTFNSHHSFLSTSLCHGCVVDEGSALCEAHPPNSVAVAAIAPRAVDTAENDCSSAMVSRWALHCIRMIAGDDAEMATLRTTTADSPEQTPPALAANPLFLGPSIAVANDNAFPFFQQMQKTKRIRTAFSPTQLVKLEQAFRRNQYLVGNERKLLAKQLALSETQVKVWFQNRRTKSKRMDNTETTTPSAENSRAEVESDLERAARRKR